MEHPEIQGQQDKVSETLVVIQSKSDNTVRLFHRFYTGLVVGDKHLSVVVKYVEPHIFVITAYFTDKVKKGAILWKK